MCISPHATVALDILAFIFSSSCSSELLKPGPRLYSKESQPSCLFWFHCPFRFQDLIIHHFQVIKIHMTCRHNNVDKTIVTWLAVYMVSLSTRRTLRIRYNLQYLIWGKLTWKETVTKLVEFCDSGHLGERTMAWCKNDIVSQLGIQAWCISTAFSRQHPWN